VKHVFVEPSFLVGMRYGDLALQAIGQTVNLAPVSMMPG
jgi:hypothetical protein